MFSNRNEMKLEIDRKKFRRITKQWKLNRKLLKGSAFTEPLEST